MNKLPMVNKTKLSIIDKYRHAGLHALADFRQAEMIQLQCKKHGVVTYEQTPWRLFADDTEVHGNIESVGKWIGQIPDTVVMAITKSDLPQDMLYIFEPQKMIDPILLLKFYDGEKFYRRLDNPPRKNYFRIYMELTRWE